MTGPQTLFVLDVVLRGSQGVDYSDIMTAPTESKNYKFFHDSTKVIRSGNDSGTTRVFDIYHPLNKRIQYEDRELGGEWDETLFSTSGKPGMGDFYILDIFQPPFGVTDSAILVEPTSTFYWHEK